MLLQILPIDIMPTKFEQSKPSLPTKTAAAKDAHEGLFQHVANDSDVFARYCTLESASNSHIQPLTMVSTIRPRARFPMKLRQVLTDAGVEGNEHIISWLPCGTAFRVHKPVLFTQTIMRRYFRQSHYRSFTRQLYHYGFERCENGAFHHRLFRRDDEFLSFTMTRKLVNESQGFTPLSVDSDSRTALANQAVAASATSATAKETQLAVSSPCHSTGHTSTSSTALHTEIVDPMEPRTIEQMNAGPLDHPLFLPSLKGLLW
mmetsp:Transcript_625/g.1145  ORF Transcript_625/g.1145 Transcript_625/m.1145 type:complete len:261 (+) Transcript_625:70-852(+)